MRPTSLSLHLRLAAWLAAAAWPACTLGATGSPAPAPSDPNSAQACTDIADDSARLACYDRRFGRQTTPSPANPLPAPAAREPASSAPGTASRASGPGLAPPRPDTPTALSQFWELDEADKRGTFRVLTFQPNYALPINVSSRVNRDPASPTRATPVASAAYKHLDAAVQLSLRVKAVEGLPLLPGADLWFAYTHRAQWQVWTPGASRPFRNTDYEPQFMAVAPIPAAMQALPGGWRWRLVSLGLAHQSNGQSEPLSRSWNRVNVGTAFERGNVSLQATAWHRLEEGNDDNPDLTDYIGRGELRLSWLPGRAIASLAWRLNPRDLGRGSWQLEWSRPVDREQPQGLRWYVRAFHGYGDSLLDYNFRKTSLGAGVMLFTF